MRIWRAVQGEGSECSPPHPPAVQGEGSECSPPHPPPHVVVRVFRRRSEEMGWWRDAVRLSMNWVKFAVYIPLTSLIGSVLHSCLIRLDYLNVLHLCLILNMLLPNFVSKTSLSVQNTCVTTVVSVCPGFKVVDYAFLHRLHNSLHIF